MKVHLVMEKAKKYGSGLLKSLKQSQKPTSSKVRDSIVVIGVKQAMLLGMLSAEDNSQQAFNNDDLVEDIDSCRIGNSSSKGLPTEIHLPQSSTDSLSKTRGKLVRWGQIKLTL